MEQVLDSQVLVKQKRRFGEVSDGDFDKRKVSIKQIDCSDQNGLAMIENEFAAMLIADRNTKHILRYHYSIQEEDCLYSCVERFACTLSELIYYWRNGGMDPTSIAIQSTPPLRLKLFRDVTKGIAHLHSIGIVHRDLRPDNIYIVIDEKNNPIAKIGDLRISKGNHSKTLFRLEDTLETDGWRSLEQIIGQVETEKTDLFNLGCVFYFILSGCHPFGFRNATISKKTAPNLWQLGHKSSSPFPEAYSLITKLVQQTPSSRLSARETLTHPVFWSSIKKIKFLSHMGNLIKINRFKPLIIKHLPTVQKVTGGPNWAAKLNIHHWNHLLRKGACYQTNELSELLRAVRNTEQHYYEYDPQLQAVIPSRLEDVFEYFNARFPKLFIEVYDRVYANCRTQTALELEQFFI